MIYHLVFVRKNMIKKITDGILRALPLSYIAKAMVGFEPTTTSLNGALLAVSRLRNNTIKKNKFQFYNAMKRKSAKNTF